MLCLGEGVSFECFVFLSPSLACVANVYFPHGSRTVHSLGPHIFFVLLPRTMLCQHAQLTILLRKKDEVLGSVTQFPS